MGAPTAILTNDGIRALANATASGTSIKPKTVTFSNQNLSLDPALSASDIAGWRTQNITAYLPVNQDIATFQCVVNASDAVDFTRFVALFLDDGTLFMVGKPTFPIAPNITQKINIPLTYANAQNNISFAYIPFGETDQDFNLLNTLCVGGNQILKNTLKLERIRIQGVN